MKETTQRAVNICQRVSKPNESDRKLLNKLYPACSSRSQPSVPQKRKFDPAEISVAETNKARKKAAVPKASKARTITLVLLERDTSTIPKGGARKRLTEKGRIKKIQIHRTMDPSTIRQEIEKAFSGIAGASKAKFMKTGRDNVLSIATSQVLSGDDIVELAGGGSVYLLQVGTQ